MVEISDQVHSLIEQYYNAKIVLTVTHIMRTKDKENILKEDKLAAEMWGLKTDDSRKPDIKKSQEIVDERRKDIANQLLILAESELRKKKQYDNFIKEYNIRSPGNLGTEDKFKWALNALMMFGNLTLDKEDNSELIIDEDGVLIGAKKLARGVTEEERKKEEYDTLQE